MTNIVSLPQDTIQYSYNTADQTANYERVKSYWSGNTFTIVTENAGTGALRPLSLNGATTFLTLGSTGVSMGRGSTTATTIIGMAATLTANGSPQSTLGVTPTINQSGTAGYTGVLINVTETATGSGAKKLIDAQVGGTSKFSVANTGVASAVPSTTAGTAMVRVAVPASATAAGVAGSFAADGNFFYHCVSANTWVRAALATW